jgi:nicotinamidase-related amidase
MTFDRVYVFGQASSHCVMSSLQDMLRQIRKVEPSWVKKIWILEDAMSPVPAPPLEPLPDSLNFPAIAQQALAEFAEAGMRVVRTTDPIL